MPNHLPRYVTLKISITPILKSELNLIQCNYKKKQQGYKLRLQGLRCSKVASSPVAKSLQGLAAVTLQASFCLQLYLLRCNFLSTLFILSLQIIALTSY